MDTRLENPETETAATARIPDENFERFADRMDKLTRRAKRLGCDVGWKETGSETVVLVHTTNWMVGGSDLREEPESYKPDPTRESVVGRQVYHLVEVTGDRPKLNGWSFVATLQHAEGSEAITIVRMVPGVSEEGLERFRSAGPGCEHCKTHRRRIDTYVVRHEDGRTAQVGSNCIKDFTGHASPEALAKQAEWLIRAGELAASEELGGVGHAIREYSSSRFLTLTLATLRVHGWLSRSKAREMERAIATSDRVMSWFTSKPGDRDLRIEPTEEDEKQAVEILEWAQERFESMGVSGRTQLSTYEWNLWVVCGHEWVSGRESGLLASLVPYWQRETGRERERAQKRTERAASEHFGTVGKRERSITLTTLSARAMDSGSHSRYGADVYTIVRFLKDGRDEAVWFASGNVEDEWPAGRTVVADLTVKAHEERDGYRQTKVNRVAVKRELEAAA